MGYLKNKQMEFEELKAQVTTYALRARAVIQCPEHPDVLECNDCAEADRHAHALLEKALQRGEIGGPRVEAHAALKAVIDDASPFGCTHPMHSDD